MEPHAVRIVEVIEGVDPSFELATEALEKILLNPRVADKKVTVFGVAGAYRKGKSFLLNFFLRYLQWRSEHPNADEMGQSEWLDPDSPLQGFSWRGGSERDTNGILIWSTPFLIKDKNGEEVAVLLMDTQGTFDSKSTVHVNTTIFALSTMISSLQIYNLSQNIQEDALQHLQLFTEFGRMALAGGNSVGEPFQSLMFLVRDWPFPYEDEFGFEGGQRLLDRKLELWEGQPKELEQVRQHISRSFKDIKCFLMPHPGLKVATNPTFDGKLADIEPDFKQKLQELIPSQLDVNHLTVKEMNGHEITCRELVEYFKVYMKNFQGNELPRPPTMYKAMAEANHLTAYIKARDVYDRNMKQLCGADMPHITADELKRGNEKAEEEAVRVFQNTPKMFDDEFNKQYLKKLEEDISNNCEELLKINNSKDSYKFMRTVMVFVFFITMFIAFLKFFQMIGMDAVAATFMNVLSLIIFVFSIWVYSFFSGQLVEFGGRVDDAVTFVWHFSPSAIQIGVLGGVIQLLYTTYASNSTKTDRKRKDQ